MADVAPRLLSRIVAPLHHVSLDTAVGIAGAGWFAAVATGVMLPPAWFFVLGASTWLVYAADHAIDGWKARRDPTTFERHGVYARHPVVLASTWTIVLILAVATARTLPRDLVLRAAPLGVASALHVLAVALRWRFFPKEMSTALVYALAVWLPCGLASGAPTASLAGAVVILALQHAVAVFSNLMWQGFADADVDRAADRPSLATRVDSRSLGFALGVACVAATLLALTLLAARPALPIAIASLVLAGLSVWPLMLHRRTAPAPRWSVDVPFQLLAGLGLVLLLLR